MTYAYIVCKIFIIKQRIEDVIMEYSNFFMLQKFSLKYKYFCFFDTKNYLADRLFIKHKVRVWFMQEYEKQGTKFLIIFCKIRKKTRMNL